PFVSAYLFPHIWPGPLVGAVSGILIFMAAAHANLAVAVFAGPVVGAVLLPVLCHIIAHLIQRLIADRNAYRETSVRLRAEIELEYQEKERVKEKLYRLERLNLIGDMAASIGHEVRNPLTTVRGYLQFFEGKDGFIQYREALRLMIEELDRANCIITEFLSLAKNKRMDLRPVNLNRSLLALRPILEVDAIS
ncbi:MAG: histidine kinase dimerization/phospho-acceptor domain-containing protein, partial [Negativicutes bacterium]|nr:histidine kinase dimerization/phospho-acceptor domain-containing protein [Negativicutes bacterium]